MPPKQVYQHSCHCKIEHVIRGQARDRSGLQPLQLRERDRTCGNHRQIPRRSTDECPAGAAVASQAAPELTKSTSH